MTPSAGKARPFFEQNRPARQVPRGQGCPAPNLKLRTATFLGGVARKA
jgi:hypothetical protein